VTAGVLVDCPCCSGSGEHCIEHRDPQHGTWTECSWCSGTGQVTPQEARDYAARAAEHTPGPTPHPTPAVPADPFLGPQDAEPF
jgi:hypothetical protein